MTSCYTTPASISAQPVPTTHELKVWPSCFTAVESGAKPFDVRENDRNFRVGDLLLLREYEPEREQYTGRTLTRWISYRLLGGSFGVADGWCVLGFQELPPLPLGILDTKLW